MRVRENSFLLKDGRTCIIRNPRREDAADLIEYLKVTASETPYLIREPEEITITLEEEYDYIQKVTESEQALLLIAEVDGKHAGNCSLNSYGTFQRYRHRCSVAIALYQEFCGMGIGKRMLKELMAEAEKCGYEQAELEVISSNQPAIRLYKQLGFQIYGTLPHAVKYKDGTYGDEYLMVKRFDEKNGR